MVSGSHLCPDLPAGTTCSAAPLCSDSPRPTHARECSGLGDLGVCCSCWTSLPRKLWGCLQNMKFPVVKGVRLQSSYLVVKLRVRMFFSTNRCCGELEYLLLLVLFNACFSAKARGGFWSQCSSAVCKWSCCMEVVLVGGKLNYMSALLWRKSPNLNKKSCFTEVKEKHQ